MQIVIFTVNQLCPGDIEVRVNDKICDFEIKSKSILINTEINSGINFLKILQNSQNFFDITDVKINNCSLRHLIYLSWADYCGRRLCPATKLYEQGMSWTLPFGYPISYWQDLILKKFIPGEVGTDLYQKYRVYYPMPTEVGSNFPQVVQDFFSTDFDFTVLDRNSDPLLLPFRSVNLKFDNREKILNRIQNNFDDLNQYLDENYSRSINSIDDPTWTSSNWRTWYLAKNQQWFIEPHQFPELFEFFNNNGITEIATATVSFLSANSYVYPHRDKPYDQKFTGACQLYIPLDFDQGNWFKMAGVGYFQHNHRDVRAYNVHRYTHSAVNLTDRDRVALIARCVIPDQLIAESSEL
jgi:hypothetical protein